MTTSLQPKSLPHAEGPEKSVLSILLQEPELLDLVPNLSTDHFLTKARQTVFSLIRELVMKQESFDLVKFVQILLDRGKLESVGGPSEIQGLYSYDFSPTKEGKLPDFVRMLDDKLARRMAIKAAHEIERIAYEAEEASEMLEATSSPISAIHDVLTSNQPTRDTKSVVLGCLERFEKLCRGEADPMGITTSIEELNRRFRGLHEKQTVVISGYPGGGKTTLAGQLAMDGALDDHNTLICSLEMPAGSLMNRMLAYVAELPVKAITDPLAYSLEKYGASGPTKAMLKDIKDAARVIATAPFLIEDLNGANVYQIAACIRRAHRKKPLKIVVVDYVQRIRTVPELSKESKERQLSHASNTLADLSKELGFCLLLPSQLNKEGAAKHAEAINEDADLHLQIVQDRTGTNPSFKHLGIAVAKDRHNGHDGSLLPIVLDGPMMRFVPEQQ